MNVELLLRHGIDDLLDLVEQRALDDSHRRPVGKDDQRRDGLDLILVAQRLGVVHVDLDELHVAVLGREDL